MCAVDGGHQSFCVGASERERGPVGARAGGMIEKVRVKRKGETEEREVWLQDEGGIILGLELDQETVSLLFGICCQFCSCVCVST